jgi:hypothetical protein
MALQEALTAVIEAAKRKLAADDEFTAADAVTKAAKARLNRALAGTKEADAAFAAAVTNLSTLALEKGALNGR